MNTQTTTEVEPSRESGKVPSTISLRTANRRVQLQRWRRSHLGVPWSVLLDQSLDMYFGKSSEAPAGPAHGFSVQMKRKKGKAA